MAGSPTVLPESRLGSTLRRDAWWVEIIPIIVLMGGFSIYATLRAFEGKFYEWGPYLSPFYSPLIDPLHHWWKFSPALLILAGPLGFRATCYYYRKALYRAFLLDPPACAVGEPRRKYTGETSFPLILQNIHRYFFYLAVVFILFLWHDAVKVFLFRWPFRHRGWDACPYCECHAAFALHVLLPFVAPSRRRQARLLFLRDVWTIALFRLARRELFE